MSLSSLMTLRFLYMVIARSLSDAAISQSDSFASLGMTNAGLFTGQDINSYNEHEGEALSRLAGRRARRKPRHIERRDYATS